MNMYTLVYMYIYTYVHVLLEYDFLVIPGFECQLPNPQPKSSLELI